MLTLQAIFLLGISVILGKKGTPTGVSPVSPPVLTLTSGPSNNKPSFIVGGDLLVGDVVTISAYTNVGLTALESSGTGTVTTAGTLTVTNQLGPLTNGTKYYVAKTARTGHATSANSNVETNTIAAGAAVATFDDHTFSTATASTFTFNAVACGIAVAGRRVVICTEARIPGATVAITGLTVNGNAATLVDGAYGRIVNSTAAAIFEIVEPIGTTCTVVVTLNGSANRCAIQAYDVVGAAGVSSVHGASTAAAPTATLIVPASGCVIGCAANDFTVPWTATNLTKNVDEATTSFIQVTSGLNNSATGSTVFTFTQVGGGNDEQAGAFATWGP